MNCSRKAREYGRVDPLVTAGRVALQRVHEGRVTHHVLAEERRPAGVAEAGAAAGLRVAVVDLEGDDLVLHVLEERRGGAPLGTTICAFFAPMSTP